MATLLHSSPTPRLAGRRRRRRHVSISAAAPDPLAAVTNLLWGKSLPPQALILAVRTTWSATWHLMMRQLAPSSQSGSYTRPPSPFPSVPSRYSSSSSSLHLFVGLPCPWAHRTLIARAILSLETLIPVSIASPGEDGSWIFENSSGDGFRTVREVYKSQIGGFDGRCTVPLLWDGMEKRVVCNESYGIIEFFNSVAGGGIDLCPGHLKGEIEGWNRIIYPNVNNGVYRCGFSQSQEAYDSASEKLFETLDVLEGHLADSRYLCGDVLTLADICLFTTLIRFDLVYNGLFRCTKKKLIEYPNLYGYTRDIYQIPKVAATCNFDAIMDGYYKILFPLNPSSIRPVMPSGCSHEALSKPHNRG